MMPRRYKLAALLMLALYAAALAHQIIPHHHGHEHPGEPHQEHCALCLLLTMAAAAVLPALLTLVAVTARRRIRCILPRPPLILCWEPCSRRGPPA